MSRTFKDKREVKTKRKKLTAVLWRTRFERKKINGIEQENDELDFCPKCAKPTDFHAGLIQCSVCDWGNFHPVNGLEEDYEPLEFPIAA